MKISSSNRDGTGSEEMLVRVDSNVIKGNNNYLHGY